MKINLDSLVTQIKEHNASIDNSLEDLWDELIFKTKNINKYDLMFGNMVFKNKIENNPPKEKSKNYPIWKEIKSKEALKIKNYLDDYSYPEIEVPIRTYLSKNYTIIKDAPFDINIKKAFSDFIDFKEGFKHFKYGQKYGFHIIKNSKGNIKNGVWGFEKDVPIYLCGNIILTQWLIENLENYS